MKFQVLAEEIHPFELLQTVRTPALQLHLKFSSYTKPSL